MTDQPILSICIPTYNRAEYLFNRINNILKQNNNDFEIIVSDNCSEDNTVELLSKIKDKRFKLIKNSTNEGSWKNIKKVLYSATGKYALLMMDKDYEKAERIEDLLNFLKNNDFPVGVLKPFSTNNDLEIQKITETAGKIADKAGIGNHPSGFLFNCSILKASNAIDILEKYPDYCLAYATDFISMMLASKGDFIEIYLPFVFYQFPPFDGLKHSYTYSVEKNNIFFLPQKRFEVFIYYIKFLNELEITKGERKQIIRKLIKNIIWASTSFYRDVLTKKNICDWYNLSEDFIESEKKKPLEKIVFRRLLLTNCYNSLFEYLHTIYYILRKRKQLFGGLV